MRIKNLQKRESLVPRLGCRNGIPEKSFYRKLNRKLSGFQYCKLTQYIKYKAALAGIRVIAVSEAYTSQYCRKCFQKGVRKIQGLFQCNNCRTQNNADRNAAFNIAQQGLGQVSNLRAKVNIPRTPAILLTGEASELVRR
jgi:transposase